MTKPEPPPFTGRTRRRTTSWSVRFADAASRLVISVGGVGTVIAVSTVLIFLIAVAAPLLLPSRVEPSRTLATPDSERPLAFGLDEYRLLAWSLFPDGRFTVHDNQTGERLREDRPLGPAAPTAAAFSEDGRLMAFGFADGSLRLARLAFDTRLAGPDTIPAPAARLEPDTALAIDDRVWHRFSDSQWRGQRIDLVPETPLAPDAQAPVHAIDFVGSPTRSVIAVLYRNGRLFLGRTDSRQNILTGEITHRKSSTELAWTPDPKAGLPDRLILSGLGDALLLLWADGLAERLDVRAGRDATVIERLDLVPDPHARLTSLQVLLGRTTLLAGDSTGRIGVWFPVLAETSEDGYSRTRMVRARVFAGTAAVTAIRSSARIRMFIAGYEDGSVRLHHVTSGKKLAAWPPGAFPEIQAVAFAPKDDAIAILSSDGLALAGFDPRHPEATAAALFRPVWYEGSPEPAHIWQSSSGTDDFEPKIGLMPLVFGTLKATFFSLLFGVPIALLAAVYTSEFLSPRLKARVKPAVELMAGLPSVVLGFLAALVFAPFVARFLPAVLAALFTLPLALLAGSHLWQLLPRPWTLRWAYARFLLMILAVPPGLALAWAAAPRLERILFAGDIMRWLDGQIGAAAGGWFLLLLLPACLLAAFAVSRLTDPFMRRAVQTRARPACARLAALRSLFMLAVALALAAAAAFLLQAAGLDPRGPLVDTYVQRNALVVGFAMGFAIIPIIYTIAEDALSAVPEHLRSASLAAGATPWQTAARIIVPTATSGLFSAVMIGLGRAVGETMIVLMAAGNTPIMEWNPFNGFRTLAANIAVELPEAVRDSTHYRTLFLAALVLFALTFVINTLAETVRLRYRKKAVDL